MKNFLNYFQNRKKEKIQKYKGTIWKANEKFKFVKNIHNPVIFFDNDLILIIMFNQEDYDYEIKRSDIRTFSCQSFMSFLLRYDITYTELTLPYWTSSSLI